MTCERCNKAMVKGDDYIITDDDNYDVIHFDCLSLNEAATLPTNTEVETY